MSWQFLATTSPEEGHTMRATRDCGCVAEATAGGGLAPRMLLHACREDGHEVAARDALARHYVEMFTLPPEAALFRTLTELFEDELRRDRSVPPEPWLRWHYMIAAAAPAIPGSRERRCDDCGRRVAILAPGLTLMLTGRYVIVCHVCANARTELHDGMGWTYYVRARQGGPRQPTDPLG